MKIGIVGASNNGKTSSRELSAAGHDVTIASSRSVRLTRALFT